MTHIEAATAVALDLPTILGVPLPAIVAAAIAAVLGVAFGPRIAAAIGARRARAEKPRPATSRQPSATREATRADWWIKAVAVLVLLAVAGAAAYVSFQHFYGLALDLGESHDTAILYPAMSDGVIVMASLVMVHCSRRGQDPPVLAWVALILGGFVTLVANVAHGWDGGTGSRLLSALAPVAFVGAYELLMWLVRSSAVAVPEPEPVVVEKIVRQSVEVPVEVAVVERVVARDRYEACRFDYEQSLQPGHRRLGRRPLMNTWGLTDTEVQEIQSDVDRERAEQAPIEEKPDATPPQPEPELAALADDEDADDSYGDLPLDGRLIDRATLKPVGPYSHSAQNGSGR